MLNVILIALFSFFVLFPILLLCYAPARNHFRYSRTSTFVSGGILCAFLSIVGSTSTVLFSNDFGITNLLCIFLLFFVYHRSLSLHLAQSLSIFLLICAYVTFLANFSIIFDAHLHPWGHLTDYSLQAFSFLLFLLFVSFALLIYPLSHHASFILDHIYHPKVWWLFASVSGLFYFFNLSMVVHHYHTLHTNKVGIAYLLVTLAMFILLLLLNLLFYWVVKILMQKAEADDQLRLLEMQEKQYASLSHYMEQEAKARHDFRQTIYTLSTLSEEKDYKTLSEYLRNYKEELPQKDIVSFCPHHALNALLNHYAQMAASHSIPIDIMIQLPKDLPIGSTDLCSIIGNILENAVRACCDVPEDKRFIRLIVSKENPQEIYIAIANSYCGPLRQIENRYLSTHKGGSGIGLLSVAATAARYDGTATFTHDGTIFYSDVVVKTRS